MSRAILTPKQVERLLKNARVARKAQPKRIPVAKAVEQLTYEADMENSFCRAMELDGWRVLKYEQNFSERKKKATGERGAADRLFIRYKLGHGQYTATQDSLYREWAQVLWIEFKRNRHKRTDQAHQKTWQDRERRRGALVWSAGEDFYMTLAGVALHYLESGLCRRRELFLAMIPPEGRPNG